MTDETARTPYCHKIRYGVTGAPEIPLGIPTAPNVTLAPTLVEIRYLMPRGEQPALVDATVTGYWMRSGERWQPEKELLHHFKNGPEGWPEWLAEEARRQASYHQTASNRAVRRRLTEDEHSAAWHAIEGTASEEGADPDTVLNAVLAALGIDPPNTSPVSQDSPPEECPECGTTTFELDHAAADGSRPFPAWMCTGCRWGIAAE